MMAFITFLPFKLHITITTAERARAAKIKILKTFKLLEIQIGKSNAAAVFFNDSYVHH